MILARLSGALDRISRSWTLLASVAVYAVFLATVMPGQARDSQAYAGDWGGPDQHFFYTPAELYRQIPAWPDAGRRDYIQFRLGWDIGWAFTYTAFLVIATSLALRRALPAGHRRRLLNLPALVPGLLDLAENAAGIALVANADIRLDALAWLAASLTSAKWITLVIAHLILLYAAGAALLATIGARRSGAANQR